jgi:hypothetical protein
MPEQLRRKNACSKGIFMGSKSLEITINASSRAPGGIRAGGVGHAGSRPGLKREMVAGSSHP